MKKITTSNVLETAWVSKELVFRSESMDAVLKRIGRKYGVSFEIMDSSLVKDTYTGVFDDIRDLYTQTPEAKMRGYESALWF